VSLRTPTRTEPQTENVGVRSSPNITSKHGGVTETTTKVRDNTRPGPTRHYLKGERGNAALAPSGSAAVTSGTPRLPARFGPYPPAFTRLGALASLLCLLRLSLAFGPQVQTIFLRQSGFIQHFHRWSSTFPGGLSFGLHRSAASIFFRIR